MKRVELEPTCQVFRTRVRPARINDAALLGAFFVQSWREVGPGALGFAGATEEAISEIASEDVNRVLA